ncbi:hypothetical protein SEUBUCD646_0B01980 [Saccharomyces eubayanus]|uniref:BSD domain-containing protein n=1 Tax=Saccharomyces eubayanus TaxID=1080349 RepID=A0ABN8VMR3_SACEU|nr:hypothetical protein SEUBUCD650_0B01990 [Saccharomyces eubayanus]CAI1854840.1 hypothetical protein SEUBUCD646_0B01980 [Saccharomyces eubayanus]
MDFFYEEQVANIEGGRLSNQKESSTEESVDATERNSNSGVQGRDVKTNEAFQKLEEEVNKQYEKTTSAFKKLVVEKDDGIEINIPISDETTEAAQKYLKKLDDNIHNVENLAQSYWSKMKTTSFWSGFGSINDTTDDASADNFEGLEEKGIAVGGNRTEAELRTLSKDRSVYLNNKMDLEKEPFDVDEKTDEICLILQGDKDIARLMNDIVPHKISYKNFWNIYFSEKNRILDKESKRKEILLKKEKEAEVAWDDEDEEIEAGASLKNEDEAKVEEPKKEVEEEKKDGGNGEDDDGDDDDDDDDDDDWE